MTTQHPVIELLREEYPKGCDKCDNALCSAAISGSVVVYSYCSSCLAKFHINGEDFAAKEIVRRFVKRHGKGG